LRNLPVAVITAVGVAADVVAVASAD